ncbi:thioredoxin family protein [Sporosarcina sp. CAU 1771]
MIYIESFKEWQIVLSEQKQFLLFVKTDHCSVCDGLLPQVEVLKEDYDFPFYIVNVAKTPEIAGQLSLFSAPVVLLFDEEKEYARFARFVPMAELNQRMLELNERKKRNE